MIIAVTGATYLNVENKESVYFLLDSIFCRFSVGAPAILISGGRSGVETIAEHLASKWNWDSAITETVSKNWFGGNTNMELDKKLAKCCDMMIYIQHRQLGPGILVPITKDYKKQIWEYYI